MLDEGVESRSDGVHWIHWKRIDSDGKLVHFLFVRDLVHLVLSYVYFCRLRFGPLRMPRTREQHYPTKLITYSHNKKIIRRCMGNILCSPNQQNVH